jgi:hypothetical protein
LAGVLAVGVATWFVHTENAREAQQHRLQQVEAAGVWTDPGTHLMWAKRDNGSDVTWQQATDDCRNLNLGGYSDWRLPTIDELQGIYDPSRNVAGYGDCAKCTFHVKGNLQLSDFQWSSSPGSASGEAWYFSFFNGNRISVLLGGGYNRRALCARRSGE